MLKRERQRPDQQPDAVAVHEQRGSRGFGPAMHCRSVQRRTGFSLVELVVVVSILTLLATASIVSLNSSLQQANNRLALAAVRSCDESARQHSDKQDCALIVDLDNQSLRIESGQGNDLVGTVSLPGGLQFRKVLANGILRESGSVSLSFIDGATTSYAVLVESKRNRGWWIIFSGPTGQCVILDRNEEHNVDEQLQKWFTTWTIAD